MHYYCNKFSLNENDLFYLIHNCYQSGYQYLSIFKQFVPTHLDVKTNPKVDFNQSKIKATTKRFTAILKERRNIHVHLFERGKEQHCFYFSYADIDESDNNHWKNGPHIHYVNYLWPEYTKDYIVKCFNKRKTDINGTLHIIFLPWTYPEHNDNKYFLDDDFDFPGAFAFSTPSQPKLYPPPPAHIATRGNWAPHIYLPPKYQTGIYNKPGLQTSVADHYQQVFVIA